MTPQEYDAFDNEVAHDFVARILEGDADMATVRDALAAVAEAEPSVFLEVSTLQEALVAAELLAILFDYPPLKVPDRAARAAAELQEEATVDDATLARSALLNLKTRTELSQLWPDVAPQQRQLILDERISRLSDACDITA